MANINKILSVEKVTKTFGKGNSLTKAVDNLSFSVKKGEFLAIMGASGSGKSTTLNLISTIDRPTSGQILVDGTDITKLKGEKLNRFRRESLGFIFQDFNLLDNLTAYENIALALSIQNVKASEIDEKPSPKISISKRFCKSSHINFLVVKNNASPLLVLLSLIRS